MPAPNQSPKPVPPKPVAPAARPTAAVPKPAGPTARKSVDPSGSIVPPKPKYPKAVSDMKGKWGDRARTLVDVLKDNNIELKSNPLARFALTLCLFMGKYAHYIDYFPGNFRKSLNEGDYKNENLDKVQKARLRAQMAKEFPKDFREFVGLYKAENAKRASEKKPALDSTEASTLYVSYLLFGPQPQDPKEPAVKYITDHKVLAARLAHEHTDINGKRAFGDNTLKAMKKMKKIPKGTVIFFVPGFKKGMTVAYATGNGKEFVYFTPGMKDKKSFILDSKTSPIKNDLNLMAAFVPTHLQAAVKPVPGAATPATTPATAPTTTPATAPAVTPSALASSVTATVFDVEKQLRVAIKQRNIGLKYIKIANILSTSIAKIEDAVEKRTPQLFDLYPKLKEKYDIALKKYYGLIVAITKIKERELEENKKKLKILRPKLKAEQAKAIKDKKVIAKLRYKLLIPELQEDAFAMIKSYLGEISKYMKRAKECLPKSASK